MEKFLREIEHIIIGSRKRLIKGPRGNRKGKGLGLSHDFYGHRIYSPGDDIRRIDWKAYPRTGSFYIREFTEERQMRVNVILDCSASMDFGKPNKFELSKLLSVGLGYITLNQRDILNIYTMDNEVKLLRENLKSKDSFYGLIDLMASIVPRGRTSFDSLTHIKGLSGGMTFIISDLFDKDFLNVLDYLSSKEQDIVVIHLMSPQEIEPDFTGELKLIDKETGEYRRVLLKEGIKEIYRQKTKAFIENCKKACDSRDIKYVFSTSDMQPIDIIAKATEVI
ncbi:MAG: DUF58 domain-containing protein [Maledivibacter sp.]|jgi:uncharacterized protein (DUF58 family)|nr:DUF58 domain-containing protein [Maledivibacter sp.]